MSDSKVPRLSIGLPAYNGEANLSMAVEGLLSQEYTDFELLISDDGSTDATPDICNSFARLDRRVRVHRHPKRIGITPNYDYLVSQARGELFMDAAQDDRPNPSYIRRCVAALDENPNAVLALSDALLVHARTRQVTPHYCSDDVASPDPVRRVGAILRNGEWLAHYGVIRRAAIARTLPVSKLPMQPPPGLGPDYIVVELGLLGPFARIAEPLFEYRYRDESGHETNENLANRIDPNARFRGTWVWWHLRNLWRMSGRHGLDLPTRLRLQAEFMNSLRTSGTSVHHAILHFNDESQRSAIQDRRWVHLACLRVEEALCRRTR